jgi:predicted DNA-binding antitoxin AbrB/MazE fold protein
VQELHITLPAIQKVELKNGSRLVLHKKLTEDVNQACRLKEKGVDTKEIIKKIDAIQKDYTRKKQGEI